jgi:hypothetical protein
MITNPEAFIAHLKRTGRLKLLPLVLRELYREEARAKKSAPRTETVEENPALISGWRTLENSMLTDHSGKSALIDIYKRIIA